MTIISNFSISEVLHDKMYLTRWNKSYVTRVNWNTHKQDFDFDNVDLHFSLSSKFEIKY